MDRLVGKEVMRKDVKKKGNKDGNCLKQRLAKLEMRTRRAKRNTFKKIK